MKLAPRDSALRAKLDYRQGYNAPTTFAKMQVEDKEAQLSQALLSDNPVTDLPLAVEVDYFRLEKDKIDIDGDSPQFVSVEYFITHVERASKNVAPCIRTRRTSENTFTRSAGRKCTIE